jgi:hypothetical protein
MRSSGTVAVTVAITLMGASAVGCSSGSKPSPTTPKSATSVASSQSAASTSAPASPFDYTGLLIKASDIKAPEIFTATPAGQQPERPTRCHNNFQ